MKINAISFGAINSKSINLIKEKQNEQKSYSQNPMRAQLKAVPLALMIAMSPLSSSATKVQEPVKTEQATPVQTKDSDVKVFGQKELYTKDKTEFCRFISYSVDGDNKNLELVGFNYNCYTKDGGIGLLNGIFQAVSSEKTEDNKYLVTYEKITKDGNSGVVEACLVPEEFGNYLTKLANSKYNNNAIDVVPTSAFEQAFGPNVTENLPEIHEKIADVAYPEN